MSSKKLAIPLSGVGKLTRETPEGGTGKPLSGQGGVTLAAWQTPEEGVPKRVVVRVDGNIIDKNNESGAVGFPCGVMQVRYSIGGYTRDVFVEAVNQSALTVWATSIEVTPMWDERRLARGVLPCRNQMLAAACSACCNDTGSSDARWLDVLNADQTVGNDPSEVWSIHPIPFGARGVRFLSTVATDGTPVPLLPIIDLAAFVIDAQSFIDSKLTTVEVVDTTQQSDTSIIIVPAMAQTLVIAIASDAFPENRAWLEWILSPDSLSGY